jgi:hypothetical protein
MNLTEKACYVAWLEKMREAGYRCAPRPDVKSTVYPEGARVPRLLTAPDGYDLDCIQDQIAFLKMDACYEHGTTGLSYDKAFLDGPWIAALDIARGAL